MTPRAPLYFVLALAVLCASPCWSQTTAPRVAVFGGYSYVPNSFSWLGGSVNGWNAALDLNSKSPDWLGFTADFAGYKQSEEGGGNINTLTFLFGPRFFHSLTPGSKLTLFGHALLGAAHASDPFGMFTGKTSFSWATGGGVDYSIVRHFALRGAVDMLHTHFTVGDNQLQPQINDWHARLSVGIVLTF